MNNKVNPVVLCILDGWGRRFDTDYNSVCLAKAPNWNRLVKENPHTLMVTFGESVGLPANQMGNSEVGHTNIGAGRVVYQDLPRITNSINKKEFEQNQELLKALEVAKKNNSTVHVMGLYSSGGIHSHVKHFLASVEFFAKAGVDVNIHAFTDGRDTPPNSSVEYIKEADSVLNTYKNVKFATISGRYYSMDRDKRWERTQLAYDAIVEAKAPIFKNPLDGILKSHGEKTTDEFIKPFVIEGYNGMKDGDVIFMINFRNDRARQILNALVDKDFDGFKRAKIINFDYSLGMVSYSDILDKYLHTIFTSQNLVNTLGEVVSKNGLNQLRLAETEKYPHVTFFFNGGQEKPFDKEDRMLSPSPKVATYDLQPEMSAFDINKNLVEAINSKKYSLIIVNFANGDMVGHTGVLDAAIKAVESVDKCLGEIEKAVKETGTTLILTADHGNCEEMWDYKNNVPHTQHTVNLVDLLVVNSQVKFSKLVTSGKLADIAPTILELMDLEKPAEMTGLSLLKK